MNLTTFSNLSPSEFLQLNRDKIPPEFISYFEDLMHKIENLQDECYGATLDE